MTRLILLVGILLDISQLVRLTLLHEHRRVLTWLGLSHCIGSLRTVRPLNARHSIVGLPYAGSQSLRPFEIGQSRSRNSNSQHVAGPSPRNLTC